MRSGRLDQQITVQRYTRVVDEGGGSILTWTDLVALRAQLCLDRGGARGHLPLISFIRARPQAPRRTFVCKDTYEVAILD